MRVDYNTLFYEEKDEIARICINTPPANKMTPEFLLELTEVIYKYALPSRAKGIILCGEGRNFSSGADIDKLLQYIKETTIVEGETCHVPDWYTKEKDAVDALLHSDKLVVAAISGCCFGSGLELALSAQIRVAEKRSLIGLPEVTFDLIPGMGGTLRMVEELGEKRAFEYVLSGELIRVSKEEDFKVIDLVVGKHEAIEAAEELIRLYVKTGEKDPKKLCDTYKNSR